MTKKNTFNPTRLNNILDVFYGKAFIAKVFNDVFNEYSQSRIRRTNSSDLEGILEEISERPDVLQLQSQLHNEISHGKILLATHVGRVFKYLPLPRSGTHEVYGKQYNEVEAYCDNCEQRVAIGLFDPRIEVNRSSFIPEQVLYADNLREIFDGGKISCGECDNPNLSYNTRGFVHVYREKFKDRDRELERRVKAIIKNVAARRLSGSRNKRESYVKINETIVNSLYEIFTSAKNKDGSINYGAMYYLFEWVKRENLDLAQLGMDVGLAEGLRREIFQNELIQLPYAVVTGRVKSRERMFEKVLEVLYNIRAGKKGDGKKFTDLYGLTWVLPDTASCYILLDKIVKEYGVKSNRVEDNLTKPRPNGYRSVHVNPEDSGIVFEFRIRTHEMDRQIRTDPDLLHGETYLVKKRALIDKAAPYKIQKVVATVLGVQR